MHETTQRLFLAAKEIAGASSLTEVAKLLKQTTQTVKNWEARGMSQAGINTACRVLEITPKWLATGEGEMRVITATASAYAAHTFKNDSKKCELHTQLNQ